MIKSIRFFLLLFFVCATSNVAYSQKENYLIDAGFVAGTNFYLGDKNSVPFRNLSYTFGAFGKYLFNGHWAAGLEMSAGRVDVELKPNNQRVHSSYVDFTALGEFNFFNLGGQKYEPYHSRISPFISLGVGVSVHDYGIGLFIPMGLGVKWLISERATFGARWTVNKMFVDNFDGIDNPNDMNALLVKDQDYYSTFLFTISFRMLSFCAPCRDNAKYRFRKPTFKPYKK